MPEVSSTSCKCPAKTWHASATAARTIGRHRIDSHAASTPQITNGTLARALIMLVWTRCAQVNPPSPQSAAPVSAADGRTRRRSQP
ncbi:MAG: hypothetical protein U0790_16905 [Isosphaeraceae bacterium]